MDKIDKRPLLVSRERNVMGDALEAVINDDPIVGQDFTYVGGYSNLRRERDAAISRGEKPQPLPYRLQWVRTQNASGRPDARSAAEWRAKGYRPVTAQDAEGLGLEVPSAAELTADGNFQVGDVMLFVASAKVAAKHEENWHRATEEAAALDAAPAAMQRTAREVAKPGEDLTFASGTRVKDGNREAPTA